jgi:minichromosome maintenance replisome factor
MFVVKDSTDEGEVRAYADKKTKQLKEKIPEYYPYLKKHIAYAKQLKTTLNEESRALINEYYVNLFNSSKFDLKFKSKRILDTLVRITKSFAKLKLKNIVDAEDTQETLEYFNAMIYPYTEATVSIPSDPKNIAISVFIDILKSSSFAYSLEELAKNACEKNEYVKSYLLGTSNNNNNSYPLLKIESNRKLRGIYELLIENSHIARIKEKPIVLQWINSKSLSDISDTTDILSNIFKNKISNDNEPSNESKPMSDMSDMSDTLSIETENYKTMDKNTSANNNETITEILKSEPMIGYTKPFYYCKEHPKVQNINHEEVKNHIQYSKEHQST